MAWRKPAPAREPRALRDVLLLVSLTVVVFFVSNFFDLFNTIIRWITNHETWQLDQLSTVTIFLLLAFIYYTVRRHHDLRAEMERNRRYELEMQILETRLQEAVQEMHSLTGLLPMCTSCKRIRDAKGEWSNIEAFLQSHTGARITEGYCPDCARRMYGLDSVRSTPEKGNGAGARRMRAATDSPEG